MKVEVRLFATLALLLPPSRHGEVIVDVPVGTTVADLVSRLAIPERLQHVALVNGDDAGDDRRLEEGDVVDLFPPLAGG